MWIDKRAAGKTSVFPRAGETEFPPSVTGEEKGEILCCHI
ncbi:hypothetical protein CLOM621_08917 [Clostridium sp. M62/1]|nr:hypothetical protein CLOM621_08917 [Clostridium sp. M62/1]